MFPIIEQFLSVDGEGPTAGRLAAFVRFQGCNLRCSWCDTTYSFEQENVTAYRTAEEIYKIIKESGASCVTLTGGEPLLQPEIGSLLKILNEDDSLLTHIETNGSVDITPFVEEFPNLCFIVDYKLEGSNMTAQMNENNLTAVRPVDTYKFVVSSLRDLQQATDVIRKNHLCERSQVFFSPVLGKIEPAEIVEFMKTERLDKVRLQLQLHKIIWDPVQKGV